MKLNPSKCAFGVSSGKFLGFMVSHRGIEANPNKIQVILNMGPPRNIKEVQSLAKRVSALNRFISKAIDKCLPFFKVLKKSFKWTDKCQKAFLTTSPQDLPHHSSFAKPVHARWSIIFEFSMSPHAVRSVLTREEGKIQKAIYYTSRALRGAKSKRGKMMISHDWKASLCFSHGF